MRVELELAEKRKTCWEKFIFDPDSYFKTRWNLFIIMLSLYNAIMVPLEFGFPNVLSPYPDISYVDYLLDVCFAVDIFFNFRTTYFDT